MLRTLLDSLSMRFPKFHFLDNITTGKPGKVVGRNHNAQHAVATPNFKLVGNVFAHGTFFTNQPYSRLIFTQSFSGNESSTEIFVLSGNMTT